MLKRILTGILVISILGFFLGYVISMGVAIAYAPDWAIPLVKAKLVDIKIAFQSSVNYFLPGGLTKDDYFVYSKILEELFENRKRIPTIYQLTEWPENVRPFLSRRDANCFGDIIPSSELIEDFIDKNEKEWALRAKFKISKSITFLKPSHLTYNRLAKESIDYVRLSRVGYDHNRKHALVYVAHYCFLCGSGLYILLRYKDESWEIVDGCRIWSS